MKNKRSPYLSYSPEVADAIAKKLPLVALESTIIAHGMPYPKNVETALSVEQIVRKTGAIPATIALIDGRLKVGLTESEIDLIGREGQKVTKCSRRDLPFILQQKKTGATTVAATMIVAAMAEIRFFATGGIGGVHRGGADSMDVSADLQELAQTPVAVISAGVKSILDLERTLEYLETHGVPVIGFDTEEFPAFYTRQSGLSVDYKISDPAQLAEALHIKWAIGMKGGALIANPIPEIHSMEKAAIDQAIEAALQEAAEKNIRGKAITPFLLAKVEQLTKGSSLKSNIQLVYNNARLAGELAVAYSQL